MQPAISRSLRIAVLTCGAVQVAVGILLFVLDIGDFIFDEPQCYYLHTVFGSGIWTGVLFSITGVHGILAGQRFPPEQIPKHRLCRLITTLTLSILGFVISITMAVFSVAAAFSSDTQYWSLAESRYGPPNGDYSMRFLMCATGAGRRGPRIHAAAFFFMVGVHFAQVLITSVSVHKLRPSPSISHTCTVFSEVPLAPRAPHMEAPPMYSYPRQPSFQKA